MTNEGWLRIKHVGNHVVLFMFSNRMDVYRVLMGEPWSYEKHLVSLCRIGGKKKKKVAVKDLVFDRTSFWVQIHDLPIRDMNPKAAVEIGRVCGDFH